ncbi:UDP-glucuronosyl UDP-glucosyltransferase domain containing protein [Aphelenchoides bicaudatus]|nr:UDP-glucuronosyl UDP-glucosyltransferase domain containing protein [Aphelenchoides bicaudatus]
MSKKLFAIFVFCLLNVANAYKILVYSTTFSKSHIVSNARIADVLAKDGHDVTLLELHYEEKPGVIEASKHAKLWRETFEWPDRDDMGDWEGFINSMFHAHSVYESHFENAKYHERYVKACDCLLNNTNFIEKMKTQKFDVFIGEQLTMCGSGISHLAGIKVHIWLSSCPVGIHFASLIGLPFEASYVPAVYENDQLGDVLTFRQRVTNLLRTISNYIGFVDGIDDTTALFRKRFGRDFPDIKQIVGESPLVLAAIDEFLDFPRPTSPRVLNIGGLGLRDLAGELKTLNGTEFADQMTKGKLGVVFFSLGSMVPTQMLPKNVMSNILKAFNNLKDYHFIVRTDKENKVAEEIASTMSNVFLTTWAPQLDILAHDRLKLFITHGGYNSILEAARLAVPIVGVGIFGDQPSNSLMAERNGWGISFNKADLLRTHETFEKTIREALESRTLREGAKRAQKLFLTRPMSAEERITKYMRFLEANDGRLPELRPRSVYMLFWEKHNLDIWACAFVAVFIVGFVSLWIVLKVIKLAAGSDSEKKKRE